MEQNDAAYQLRTYSNAPNKRLSSPQLETECVDIDHLLRPMEPFSGLNGCGFPDIRIQLLRSQNGYVQRDTQDSDFRVV